MVFLLLVSKILPKAPNASISTSLLALPAFFNFNPDNQSSYSSGIWEVAIYVANKLAASKVNFPDCNLLDCICVSLKLHGHDSLFIACVYRSPSSPLQLSSEQFLQKASTYSHLLVCGDFNYSSFDWSNGSVISSSPWSI